MTACTTSSASSWPIILTVGLVSLRRGGRAGQPRRFLAGFEAVGWPALILSAACFVLARPLVEAYQEWMFSIASAVTGVRKLDGMPTWRTLANIVALFLIYSVILMAPTLVPALVAGWLAARLRLGGSAGEPDSDHPPPAPVVEDRR